MSTSPIVEYVDRAGNPPAEPFVGPLPSSDPARLAAILAALGFEVSAADDDGGPPVFTAQAAGVGWRVVPRGETPVQHKETHYFLGDNIAAAFDAAIAAGASALIPPQRTSFGLRFTIADADGRKFVVTERGTETAGMSPPDDEETMVPAQFDETPPDRSERRSLKVQRWGIGANLLGTFLLIAAALFRTYLTIFFGDLDVPGLAVRAWSLTIPIVWSMGLAFLFVGRLTLLFDPGRTLGLRLLAWALAVDVVNFLFWLLLLSAREEPWAGLFFYYLSAIAFTRYLVVATRDLRADRAARAADWANSGFMLALLLWMAELLVVEMFTRHVGRSTTILIFETIFLAVHALLLFALFRFARYSADRLFRTVEIEAIRRSPDDRPRT